MAAKSSYTGVCIVPIPMTTCYVVLEVVSRAVTIRLQLSIREYAFKLLLGLV